MNTTQSLPRFSARVALLGALLLAPLRSDAQLPRDPVERAKVVAQIFEANASQLTLFDRAGKEIERFAPRGLYDRPVMSPDGTRVAVIQGDIDKETRDVWVIEIATGKGTQITANQPREPALTPTWSPDGKQVAYVSLRTGSYGLFHKNADGSGNEILEYKSSAPLDLTDWSMDGRFLSFFTSDLGGSALYSLPIDATGEKKPIELLRSPQRLQGPRISPDGHYALYVSMVSNRLEVFVRPFDPASPQTPPSAGPWQVSDQGSVGMAYWRRDGKELYFLTPNRTIMAVDVTTAPQIEFGKPHALFNLSETSPINASQAGMARDGQRVVIAVPPPQLRQLTLLDRQGRPVGTVGPPGLYGAPVMSPDGTRVALTRTNPQNGWGDIWTFDLATGKGTAISNDQWGDIFPVWSPDSKFIAYVSQRQNYFGIYRKPADGSGNEELLFRYTPGAGVLLTDWSADGKFFTFFTGALLVVPLQPALANPLDRKEIEWIKDEYDVILGRFSPDSRFLAYLSNEIKVDVMQIYLRPFDGSKPEKPAGPAVQITTAGVGGGLSWRQDGKELFYLSRDWEVMALDITTTPGIQAGTPRVLFKLPMPMPALGQGKFVTPDGQRFLVAMPSAVTPTR